MKKLIVFGVLLFGIGSALGVSAPSAMVSVEQHPDKTQEMHAVGLALSDAKQQGYLSILDPDKKKKVEDEFQRLEAWFKSLSKKWAALKKQQTRDGFLFIKLQRSNKRLYEECSKSNMFIANIIKDRLSKEIQDSKDKELAYNAKYARKNRDLKKRARAKAKKFSSKFTTSVFGKVAILEFRLLREKIDAGLERRYTAIFILEPGIWRMRARNKLVKDCIAAEQEASAGYIAYGGGNQTMNVVTKPYTYPKKKVSRIMASKTKIAKLRKRLDYVKQLSDSDRGNKIKGLEKNIESLQKYIARVEKEESNVRKEMSQVKRRGRSAL